MLLSNAWDHNERKAALERFHLDEKEFQARHELVVSSFERGEMTIDEYLDHIVLHCKRPFSREEFRKFMFSLSTPKPDVLDFARKLTETGHYLMGTINNESRELNLYRMERFELRKIFRLFVSSCFVGLRKPECGIYRLALEITQISPRACCFIDDRALNLECASELGMHTIQMQNLDQLQGELEKLGVDGPPGSEG